MPKHVFKKLYCELKIFVFNTLTYVVNIISDIMMCHIKRFKGVGN